jgi:four helix bundle protein
MAGRNYTDLFAWQKAMLLVEEIYAASRKLPKEELYGLTSQLRRAAVSVPANVAEGQGRRTGKEFRHFLSVAHGSLRELETCVMLCQRLGYTDRDTCERLMVRAGEVGRLINALSNSIARSGPRD